MNYFFAVLIMLLAPPALWYLGSRAEITRWLWRTYPPRFARFMDCAACTGFWWGVIIFKIVYFVLITINEPSYPWYTEFVLPVLMGLCSLVTTPMIAFLHDRALYNLGTAVMDPDATPPE